MEWNANEMRNDGKIGTGKRWWRKTWFKLVVAGAATVVIVLGIAAEYVLHHAGPIVRNRVVETLSAKFHAPVQLANLQISLLRGIEVEGDGLRIPYTGDGSTQKTLISVKHFSFRTSVRGLLHQPTHIAFVRVDGLTIDLPPGPQRKQALHLKNQPHKVAFSAGEILATNVTLTIETNKPGKTPLQFNISRLDLRDIGRGKPMSYDANLVNPKPIGNIHAVGHFGPWKPDDPRQTPVSGDYSFRDADLNSIKGLGGILSSTGHYEGVLERITIDGTTDTPNFSLDISNHPMPLTTVFHAYVDGTDGDTYLDPVKGMLAQTEIIARGKIVNIKGQGHDIQLNAVLPHARMEDVLELGVKTNPPLMSGALTMHTSIHIPPGKERVSQKIQLAGSMQITHVEFTKIKWQNKVDDFSMRAQGKPEDAKAAGSDNKAEVASSMSLNFQENNGVILVDDLQYKIPGALVAMNGVYSTDGKKFEFKGHVRTTAEASQMVTGWKSLLLKPLDPFLKKNGAGMELPISISGTQGDIKFGLAMHGSAGESAAQIAAGMRTKPEQAKSTRKK
jgi:hypothetical protein